MTRGVADVMLASQARIAPYPGTPEPSPGLPGGVCPILLEPSGCVILF